MKLLHSLIKDYAFAVVRDDQKEITMAWMQIEAEVDRQEEERVRLVRGSLAVLGELTDLTAPYRPIDKASDAIVRGSMPSDGGNARWEFDALANRWVKVLTPEEVAKSPAISQSYSDA